MTIIICIVISILFLIFCIIDFICYMEAPHPERKKYISFIPGCGIYAYYKTRNKSNEDSKKCPKCKNSMTLYLVAWRCWNCGHKIEHNKYFIKEK